MTIQQVRIGDYVIEQTPLHYRDAIRWAVGRSTERRSSTWRLWGDKKGDVYLSTRSLGSRMKASFHRDRRCSVGFTAEYEETAKERFDIASRHWHRWALPQQPVVRAAQILYPYSELSTYEAENADPMQWVPIAKDDDAAVISIFIAEPPAAFDWKVPENGTLLGYMHAPTRLTWVVHTSQKLEPAIKQRIESTRDHARRAQGTLTSSADEPNARMIIFDHQSAPHDVYFIDVSACRQIQTA